MSNTYNTPDCTCGQDHDELGNITISTLFQLEDQAEKTHETYTPEIVGQAVAEAAAHIGWHRDPARAAKTFNNDACTCDLDHDSLEHIVGGTVKLSLSVPISIEDVRDFINTAAAAVGWVKA